MSPRYLLWRARWVIAACCIAAAVSVLVTEAAPRYVSVPVARLTHDVAAGTVLTATDIDTLDVPAFAAPTSRLAKTQATGRRTVATLPAGTILTTGILAGEDALAADPDGRVLLTIPLSPLAANLAQPGASVTLYALPPEGIDVEEVARDVRVLSVHRPKTSIGAEDVPLADVAVAASVATVVLGRAGVGPLLVGVGPPPSTPPRKEHHG